jgi:hypothetical protein
MDRFAIEHEIGDMIAESKDPLLDLLYLRRICEDAIETLIIRGDRP